MNKKLEGLQAISIFPLSTVLVPGMAMPLHIFEPRYRALLRDCLEADQIFGLSYQSDAAVDLVTTPAPGSIGCAAQVMTVAKLPDGRSNILALGLERYEIREYERTEPYLVAKINFFEDDRTTDPAALRHLVKTVRALFERFASALQILSDTPGTRLRAPEEPQAFSFAVAAAVITEAEELQALLVMRSTQQRLELLDTRLSAGVDELEERAAEHVTVRGNGHRKTKLTIH